MRKTCYANVFLLRIHSEMFSRAATRRKNANQNAAPVVDGLMFEMGVGIRCGEPLGQLSSLGDSKLPCGRREMDWNVSWCY